MIRLLAFLGNYGQEHHGNRHNIAWQFLESLSEDPGLPEMQKLRWSRGFKGRWSTLETAAGRVWLLTPETYMNLSGQSVKELMKFHKIEPNEVLVIHDELELRFGIIDFKSGGGLGGHNGLRSVKEELGTADFQRFRLGIGRPGHDDISAYVLSNFSVEEKEKLTCSVFPQAIQAFALCLSQGFDEALGRFRKHDTLA